MTFLCAVVGPWAAYIIDRDYGPAMRAQAHHLRAVGLHAQADQMLAAVDQLREAGRQRMEAHRGEASGVGSAEVPQVEAVPGSGRLLGSGVTTREAATQLRVSQRQVGNYVAGGKLVAALVRGAWVIDEVSLAELIESRRDR